MGLVLPSDDVIGIAERVRQGDPVAGWRGDPTMDTYLDEEAGLALVYGFDRAGNRYIAASTPVTGAGWRHELLRKLRDGDWQRPDTVDRVMKKLEGEQAARDAVVDDALDEKAERLAWALKRDAGYMTGLSKEFY